ncbi:FAD-binding domain-containing protein [Amniculicola lignicola CBS 123094]|uniref:FAD-binding domain-containing protein n=1 Tax=Amniculicola lignicola CBS 123094 TaxID=1392246 RepID=A0A6A5WBC9_9PLEO|nr:FAD-binding domain-containing protein [Amniculicola lignicola CBS 123094]
MEDTPLYPPYNYTCLPSQPCWPSTNQWITFNQSISGNLKLTVPWAAPCYNPAGMASQECQAIGENYMDGVGRTAQYGSMEFLDWETCGESNCFLNSFQPSSPVSGQCSLGRLSTYHVEAHSPDDISKALNFSREHGIRVSIKNSGHDYFGRSSAANSLAIWTHKMKDLKYHGLFRPKCSKTQYTNIGEIGAGVQAQEAWEFFEQLDMLVTVGAVGSVGLAGGFGQGGGHGPLGPSYGLMVDQAVEFDVVTADGQARTINECSDPELFWAMRGGGGGTYAILTSYKFQLHPAVPMNVYGFQAEFPMPEGDLDITESKVHRDIIRALARNQTLFANNGVAGYNFLLPDHMVSIQVLPSANTDALEKITTEWHDFLTNYPGLNITENTYYTFNKFSDWHKYTEKPSIARNGPVGVGIAESGRFIPKRLFNKPADIENLVNAVVDAMQFSYTNRGGGSAQLYATGPHNHPDNSKTGVNPGWRDTMWEVIMGGFWTRNTPAAVRTQIQNTISASIQPFKALTPGGGCYMNEGDWLEENWQQTFFGSNYDKLLAVKNKYDPTGLFNCWKCVGWSGYEDPMYSCYAQSKKTPKPSVPLGPVS